MKKLISMITIMLFVLLGCSTESTSNEMVDVKVALDWTPNTNHIGIYVAQELGYYEEENLNVEILQPSESATESLVATNKIDFGVSYSENVAQFNQEEQEITSIMSLVSTNTSGLLSRKEENITRPKDLEGKTYCGWGSDIESALIKNLVESDGGNADKVEITTSGGSLESENSPCDVVWGYEGWDKINLDQQDIENNYIPITYYGMDWYTPVIITSNEYLENNKDTVQSFINATKKGYEYAIKNPQKSADILIEYAPELDEELVYSSQYFLSEKIQKDGHEMGYQDPKIWTDFGEWLKTDGIIKEDSEIDSYYTNEFIEK